MIHQDLIWPENCTRVPSRKTFNGVGCWYFIKLLLSCKPCNTHMLKLEKRVS